MTFMDNRDRAIMDKADLHHITAELCELMDRAQDLTDEWAVSQNEDLGYLAHTAWAQVEEALMELGEFTVGTRHNILNILETLREMLEHE